MKSKKIIKKKIFVLILISLVVLLSILYFSYKDLIFGENNKNKIVNNQQKLNFNKNQENNKNLSGSGGIFKNENLNNNELGSSGGSGGSSGGGSSSQNCIFKQISYSMINLNKTFVCNQFQGSICVDKTVTCSIVVENLDNEVNGFFDIKLIFLEEGKNQEYAFDSKTSRFFLNFGENHFFEDFTNIQSSGINGSANKNINCFFNTLEIPKKQVC